METTVAIDRDTGRVIHPTIGNTVFPVITVLNRGSDQWSFKVMADSGEGGHVRFYEVHEYVEGTVKPLVAVVDGIAFWGTCR